MAPSSAVPITLAGNERRVLEGLARVHGTRQQQALPARMVLLTGEGLGVHETACPLGV